MLVFCYFVLCWQQNNNILLFTDTLQSCKKIHTMDVTVAEAGSIVDGLPDEIFEAIFKYLNHFKL